MQRILALDVGEVECSVRGLRAREMSRSVELLEFRED